MAQMEVKDVPLNKIKLGTNCRLNINAEDISGLMQAIKAQGLLQPVGVIPTGNAFELAYGNRRYLAASKLGWTTIPAVILEANGKHSRDLKNLTENVQRQHISLIEAGRFIGILEEQGLTQMEIAVRMGVSGQYVKSCKMAYTDVPKEYRGDIEMTRGSSKVRAGKVSITAARTIMNSQKTYGLNGADTKALFKSAKEDPNFTEASVPKYAAAIKRGHRHDFINKVRPTMAMRVQFFIDGKEATRLKEKYIVDGPFKSMTQLMLAILKGEKHERIKIL